MIRLPGFLVFIFLLFVYGAGAQVEHPADTVVKDYNSYDTVLPKNDFVDTVHHLVFTQEDSLREKGIYKLDLVKAENERRWIKTQIVNLSSYKMHGRGYVKDGRDSAARYILKKLREFKLKPVGADNRWAQGFAFPVNTFPGRMFLSVNGDSLSPGIDFIIDPASPSYSGERVNVKAINLSYITDTAAWHSTLGSMDGDHVYYLQNPDSFCQHVLHIRISQLATKLPAGCFIIPMRKLTWSVSRETIPATVFYVDKDVLPRNLKKVTADVNAVLLPHARSENIIACMPGDVKDSFIVFSAHYDHLGMMGDTTYFPGASDNASGIAMLLYLASYYSKHPQHYTIVFIAFAGEEAALMGSEFFVTYPMIPLKNIKFLTNIDIMGDATDGVTVVNATENPKQFELLQKINEKNKYLPEIRSRGKAANSDHYYFSEAGVPAFFIYSNGGNGFYHDVYDRAREVTLNHIDDVANLLEDFVKNIR